MFDNIFWHTKIHINFIKQKKIVFVASIIIKKFKIKN